MRAQRYRHRITFEEQVHDQDSDTGATEVSWAVASVESDSDLEHVPAQVLTGAGREPITAGAKQSETSARINLRWFPGLDPSWRILWEDKVYDIVSIETDATGRREYRLQCKDGLSDGA